MAAEPKCRLGPNKVVFPVEEISVYFAENLVTDRQMYVRTNRNRVLAAH